METQEIPNRDIVTTIRLSAEEHEFLRSVAESQHRSISGQVRFMVAQLRAEHEPA